MKLETSLQAALRKHYSELVVQPPFELDGDERDARSPRAALFANWSGLAEALDAARGGNRKLVDEIELFWLNTWGPRPTIDEEAHLIDDGCGRVSRPGLLAMGITRGAGPRGWTLVEWGLVLPCGRCWGRVKADPHCRFCSGRKHLSDAWEVIYTDIEGRQVDQ